MKFECYVKKIIFITITTILSSFVVIAEAVTFSVGDYYYIASALNHNMVLDVSGGSRRDGANIQLYEKIILMHNYLSLRRQEMVIII